MTPPIVEMYESEEAQMLISELCQLYSTDKMRAEYNKKHSLQRRAVEGFDDYLRMRVASTFMSYLQVHFDGSFPNISDVYQYFDFDFKLYETCGDRETIV